MRRFRGTALIVLVFFLGTAHALAAAGEPAADWVSYADGQPQVTLYFFWSQSCPHCLDARPFVRELDRELVWLDLEDLEISGNPANGRRYVALARQVGERAHSVPAFLFCGTMLTGYDEPSGTGAELRRRLEQCHQRLTAGQEMTERTPSSPTQTTLPLIGEVNLSNWSLPAVAVVLGGLDSFNPCAFFVLLFLLSLLVNARSRVRMAVVGGLFIFVSAFVYFLFMAAWLNLFLVMGQLMLVTVAAGVLALVIGGLNIKDYFRSGAGPSLSVPERARPGLFRRMRGLISTESWTAVVSGTLVLAVVANAYELLCTVGLPMVFTRLLTLEPLPPVQHYAYLALYCAVYVVPLLLITGAFVITLGRRKLTEREGQVLKLLSGLMMTALGLVLVIRPALLTNALVTGALLAGAISATWLIQRLLPRA